MCVEVRNRKANVMTENFRPLELFISHSSIQKERAHNLREELQMYGCSAFVAHEDISPNRLWQEDITAALKSTDVLIGLCSKEFNESPWCQQEIGWALGRGIPVLMVKLNSHVSPTGFVSQRQAFRAKGKTDYERRRSFYNDLFKEFRAHTEVGVKFRKTLLGHLQQAGHFLHVDKLVNQLKHFAEYDDADRAVAQYAIENNGQLSRHFSAPNFLGELMGFEPNLPSRRK